MARTARPTRELAAKRPRSPGREPKGRVTGGAVARESGTRTELGRRAEALVVAWLAEQGYDIVATNLRLGALEIDVVARKGPVVSVVEVRTRGKTARTTPFGSIGPAKQLRLRRAGERLWQRRYRHDPSVERLRFDVAGVRFDRDPPTIEYVVAAF